MTARLTPEEFAAQTGLSLEEATFILHRRQVAAEPANARVSRARSILALAQKKVGVQPVAAESGSLEKVYDPDAEEGLTRFYGRKDVALRLENGQKPDPPWWDEFDQSGKDSE